MLPKVLDPADHAELLQHFSTLLSIDSRNPGCGEQGVANYLRTVLEREGYEVNTVEATPGRPNVCARLSGKEAGPSLLLCAHMDTVPFDESRWKHSPLGAFHDSLDDCIYGRGAIDMKHHLAYCLMTMLLLKRRSSSSDCTVKFAAFADEEQGCTYGSKFLVEQHPDLVRADFGLNEVGGFPLYFGTRKYFTVGVEEKGFAWVKITLRGEPGHGSIPAEGNLILSVSDLVQQLRQTDATIYYPHAVREFLSNIAKTQPFPASSVLRLLAIPWLNGPIISALIPAEKRPSMRAMFRNTYNPTVIEAKSSLNVVPSELTLCLDCRIMPGSSVNDIVHTIRGVVGERGTVEILHAEEPLPWEGHHSLLDIIAERMREITPQTPLIPLLSLGFTDNSQLRKLGNKMVGFTPMDFPPDIEFSKLFHGHNERIPRSGLLWGFDTFWSVVSSFIDARRS